MLPLLLMLLLLVVGLDVQIAHCLHHKHGNGHSCLHVYVCCRYCCCCCFWWLASMSNLQHKHGIGHSCLHVYECCRYCCCCCCFWWLALMSNLRTACSTNTAMAIVVCMYTNVAATAAAAAAAASGGWPQCPTCALPASQTRQWP